MTAEAPAWRRALAADPAAMRLTNHLAFANGFNVYVLVCASARVTRAVLALLADEVPARREHPVHILHLDPYERFTDPVALAPRALADWAFEALLAPSDAPEDPITVLDATRFTRPDEPAWEYLFARLNERRNALTRQLRGPLVMALAPSLEAVFARHAPDVWSIKRGTFPVQVTAPTDDASTPARHDWNTDAHTPYTRSAAPRLQHDVDAARADLDQRPGDPRAMHSLAIRLARLAEHQREWSTLTAAITSADEAAELSRAVVSRAPSPEAFRWLSRCLGDAADLHLADGASERALALADESLSLAQNLHRTWPDSAESSRELAHAHLRLGDVHRARGAVGPALDSYETARGLYADLARRAPEDAAAQRELTAAYERSGDVLRDVHERAAALGMYLQALELTEARTRRAPTDTLGLRDLAAALLRVGDVHADLGEHDSALRSYERALDTLTALLRADPDPSDWRVGEAVALGRIAGVHTMLGELDRASAALAQAERSLRGVIARDPERPTLLLDLARLLGERGRVERGRGHATHAEESLVEALDLTERLVTMAPASVVFQHARAVAAMALAAFFDDRGERATARDLWTRALGDLEGVAAMGPSPASTADDLARCRAAVAAAADPGSGWLGAGDHGPDEVGVPKRT